ncbi:MAG: hypothetical protein K2L45_02100 [Muribaculaceae bacterium]|nr:hypothetical protein [Muribaculaceae bacterium]
MNSTKNILKRMCRLGIKLAVATVCLFLVGACNDEKMSDLDGYGIPGTITIKLSSRPIGSRAETEPDDTGNENLINDAIVCIFKAGASEDTDKPVVMQTIEITKRTDATVTLQLNKDKIDDIFPEGVDRAVVHIFANIPAVSKALLPADPTLGDLKALSITANFASRQQPSSFVMFGDDELVIQRNVDNTTKDQVSGAVRLKRAASKISLNIRVKDSVTDLAGREWTPVLDGGMSVFITNGVNTSSVMPSSHGVPASSDYYFTSASSPNEYQKGRGFTKDNNEDEETGYPYILNQPFYTYPNQWTDDSETMTYMTLLVPWRSEGSYRSCYYMVPVVRDESHLVNNVSYRVSINVDILGNTKPDEPLELENVSYRAVPWGTEAFNVDIDDFRYLVIDNNTYTMNNEGLMNIPFYSSHETVIKYDVDTLNYYLFNTTAAGLEKEMAITNTQRRNSTTTNADIPSYANVPGYSEEFGSTKNIYNDWIDNTVDPSTNTRSLYFQHELYQWNARSGNNNVSYGPYTAQGNQTAEARANASLNTITSYQLANTNTPAYSRYRMTITIVHKDKLNQPDEDQFSEKIVIWQYPPMYIETQQNFYEGTSRDQRTASRGNMWINGFQNQEDTENWYVTYGLGGSADNANPNQYVISVTQLSEDVYVIGDPRVTTINNLTNNFTGNAPAGGWVTAPGIENANTDNPSTTRKLSYYYPSDQANNKMYTVAPQFRVASSYGVAYDMSYTDAQRRCASYQELQYPAGRWRIPTVGEIEYIMNLSNEGKIPALFTMSTNNNTNYYWSAQGRINARLTNGKLTAPANIQNNQTASVRCVYDEWYWDDSTIKTTATQTYGNGNNRIEFPKYPFVWGDKAR